MARGGARPGAGRKPGPRRRKAVVLGMDGARKPGAFALPAPMTVEDADGLCEPPADLQAEEQAVWRALAPHAVRERTLIPSKAPGFRQLCRQWVYCAALDVRIRHLGIVSAEADRLLRRLE